ncbi:hypothetical protein FHL15_000075 [Xylaria flabelliformis]|uniref:Uncharacterized protein n=1 Tax=Xylaria flabelliformis TaxID=2512241 RepID=A0A553IEU6_9PEZI|nr:hypothetical protein FHL15_000075 [Xylaria flabelliformis]
MYYWKNKTLGRVCSAIASAISSRNLNSEAQIQTLLPQAEVAPAAAGKHEFLTQDHEDIWTTITAAPWPHTGTPRPPTITIEASFSLTTTLAVPNIPATTTTEVLPPKITLGTPTSTMTTVPPGFGVETLLGQTYWRWVTTTRADGTSTVLPVVAGNIVWELLAMLHVEFDFLQFNLPRFSLPCIRFLFIEIGNCDDPPTPNDSPICSTTTISCSSTGTTALSVITNGCLMTILPPSLYQVPITVWDSPIAECVIECPAFNKWEADLNDPDKWTKPLNNDSFSWLDFSIADTTSPVDNINYNNLVYFMYESVAINRVCNYFKPMLDSLASWEHLEDVIGMTKAANAYAKGDLNRVLRPDYVSYPGDPWEGDILGPDPGFKNKIEEKL